MSVSLIGHQCYTLTVFNLLKLWERPCFHLITCYFTYVGNLNYQILQRFWFGLKYSSSILCRLHVDESLLCLNMMPIIHKQTCIYQERYCHNPVRYRHKQQYLKDQDWQLAEIISLCYLYQIKMSAENYFVYLDHACRFHPHHSNCWTVNNSQLCAATFKKHDGCINWSHKSLSELSAPFTTGNIDLENSVCCSLATWSDMLDALQ